MPKEVRYLLFASHEADQAILAYIMPRNAIVAPRASEFVRVSLSDDPDAGVRATIAGLVSEVGINQQRRLDMTELLAALLDWCRVMGVPLPRRGTKGVELLGGSLALTVTLNAVPAEPSVRANAVRYRDPELERIRLKAQ